jgi:hypothetical protein
MGDEPWHLVEAKRDDGQAVMFRIRELAPRPELARIFVVELPYETTEMSHLPSATAYRRLQAFEEQWLAPAAGALGLVFVGVRTEDHSHFLYLYGNGDPKALVARLAPFDPGLGFYDDDDPAWSEYTTLRELLDAAKEKPDRDLLAPDKQPRGGKPAQATTRMRASKKAKKKKKS